MNKLEYGFAHILERNRDGSYATQSNRRRMLSMFADQLKKAGYKTNEMRPSDIKGRHINALVRQWSIEGLSAGTMKNRMSNIRWLAEKIGKTDMIKSNAVYGIEDRQYITNKDKSLRMDNINLDKLSPHVRQSIELQRHFGLRREEAMKFCPDYALGGYDPYSAPILKIKPSWAKGGRARNIPITSDDQRNALMAALTLAGDGSLIPADRSYKKHLGYFERETSAIGLGQTHGLRHLYAQNRYKELVGIDCPAVGGIIDLTNEQKALDLSARQIISNELGHNRLSVTGIYLGSWSYK
uniref:phage integrase N-terminal domain-containing protein n=1 Tax=Psychrobacter sp. TaxID=56811 RepID=UPI001599001F|nr:phage integrase N-terminal domain-containing protein [Psychrobacter sp.]QJS05207.1 phage integrase [Psychrobacter sp.]